MADGAALQIDGLHGFYGESHVLHGLSLAVERGEAVAIIGRNGAGKTTTMRAIMGLLERRSGSIKVKGKETIASPPETIARLGVGFVPEERGIYASLDVTDNLLLPPKLADGGTSLDRDLSAFPEPARTAPEPGHAAVRRRTADARDRARAAHRRRHLPARRADGRAGSGHRRADLRRHRGHEGERPHRHPGRAEFPRGVAACRPALRHGARPDRRCHCPGRAHRASSTVSARCWESEDEHPGHSRAVAGRPHQRLVLRHDESRPCHHLRTARHRQYRAGRLLHDGRVLQLDAAALGRHRLFSPR